MYIMYTFCKFETCVHRPDTIPITELINSLVSNSSLIFFHVYVLENVVVYG